MKRYAHCRCALNHAVSVFPGHAPRGEPFARVDRQLGCLNRPCLTNPRVKNVASFSPVHPVLLGCSRLLCYVFDPRVSSCACYGIRDINDFVSIMLYLHRSRACTYYESRRDYLQSTREPPAERVCARRDRSRTGFRPSPTARKSQQRCRQCRGSVGLSFAKFFPSIKKTCVGTRKPGCRRR